VHELASLHEVPLAASVVAEQVPVEGSQTPAMWHESGAVHVTVLVPVQEPLWQVSPNVHELLSLHAVPLAAIGLEQTPVDGLHVPATWQASRAVQVTVLVPLHTPLWQVSAEVHRLLSLHVVPLATEE
jgi:hypothetical protein